MEAIILAGGFGTRLKSVVSDVPKPMAPIQNKPFLAYLLTFLAKHGISKFVLSVGYMNEKIVDYFGQSFLSVPISYVIENKALGTGGAIKLALKKVKTDNVLVYN
ncbi:MAG: sugar phosphate nucleotidyltransferase, partial [Bacteroidota bacterium]|nr:sugar phosphate nucleotidyltransferase [Bacteroidota bacterium]